ncbi:phosphomannomutase/phosphoglucomutase [Marinobacter sp. F4216]|uniref:phosphomannomutase/phosphoglucomutase n=1 Tax=Marinobacter sp. F4216 TaxID=2874281 RepID=UPI002958A4FE|nr:phosphomannomutase/phosphoglucomutase [Marinobacter sp. F4216]MBZ2169227.1 phosphomannomutase/phosphoglucomutase [Marinobacter sp. F4216]
MKLGKDKASEPSAKKAKSGKVGSSGPGLKQKRLDSVALKQALAVFLAGIVAVVLVHFLVVQPATQAHHSAQKTVEADAAAQRLNLHLTQLQESVNSLATRSDVVSAVTSGRGVEAVLDSLDHALPGLKDAHLFANKKIPRSAGSSGLLGFAGLELARKAQEGQASVADAFPRDGRWYFQMAAPVQRTGSDETLGSLLVIFEAARLQPLLQVVNADLGGTLALTQSVSGTVRTVAGSGQVSAASETRALINPDWSVAYMPASGPQAPVNIILLAGLIGVPVLLAAVLVWLLLTGAQRSLRTDVSRLIQWAQKALAGERAAPPIARWEMVGSAGEAMNRMAQMVEKRVAKAAGSAKPRKPASLDSTLPEDDEPLFQGEDSLDIDVLSEDEDVLNLGSGDDSLFGDDALDVGGGAQPSVNLSPEIFRAYDIRGIVGESLSEEVVQAIGQAIGSEALVRGVQAICIGYDGRHSSPGLAAALGEGIMATGCDVINVGAVPTPVLYFATHELGTGSGVMVTGSHNPANYNGLKIMLGGETLSGEAIQKLYQRVRTGDLATGQGNASRQDVRRAYLDRILQDVGVAVPMKVVVDAGNGIAGELGPMLLDELGCEVIPLYCDVDGNFPNHHPDPGKPANLADLIARVQEENADIGLAFDGDGDRLGVVTNTGKIIWPDRLLMLFARDVVSRNPGADVLYDVKCSRRLANTVSEAGGRPIMWKTGHSLMKAKMKEAGALLAGEMSGHIFFGERWFGFDDGLYSAARLLEILGAEDRHSSEVFEDFPEDVSTPELNVDVTESTKFAIVERLSQEGEFGDGRISTIDGVRVDYPDGWGLCRASNTTPVLVLRFEAETEAALERIKDVFRAQLAKVAPEVTVEL